MADESATTAALSMDRGLPLGNSEDNLLRRALHTKVLNKSTEPIFVQVVTPTDVTPDRLYRFASALLVPPNTETTILTFVAGALTILERARVSGDNRAVYYLKKNGAVIDELRTSLTSFNCEFDFFLINAQGYQVNSGDIIQVTVVQNGPDATTYSANIQGILPTAATGSIHTFAEVLAVSPGIETTILSYTAAVATNLQRARVSGDNMAVYFLKVNGSVIDEQRSSLTEFNALFDMYLISSKGYALLAGDLVTVSVLHSRPYTSNHNAMIQGATEL